MKSYRVLHCISFFLHTVVLDMLHHWPYKHSVLLCCFYCTVLFMVKVEYDIIYCHMLWKFCFGVSSDSSMDLFHSLNDYYGPTSALCCSCSYFGIVFSGSVLSNSLVQDFAAEPTAWRVSPPMKAPVLETFQQNVPIQLFSSISRL